MDTYKKKYTSPSSPYLLEFIATQQLGIVKKISDKIIQYFIKQIALRAIDKTSRKHIQFNTIRTVEQWSELLAFRLENYSKTVPYLLNELDEYGSDCYDNHSLVFGIWYRTELIASIRYTTWPFEMTNLLDKEQLATVIGDGEPHDYLELSRLLIQPKSQIKGALASLLMFSGLTVCANTNYKRYIGYTKKAIFKKFCRFECHPTLHEFTLKNRGDHAYVAFQGDFKQDFIREINKVLPFKVGEWLSNVFFRQ